MRKFVQVEEHNDWQHLTFYAEGQDLEVAGLLKNVGTGVNPVVQLTERGQAVATQLRVFKAAGGQFANFQVEV